MSVQLLAAGFAVVLVIVCGVSVVQGKRLPTLVVWGREDPIVPLSAGQLYHESIPGSKLAIIDNCGHRPEIEKPEEFIRVVQDFLRD